MSHDSNSLARIEEDLGIACDILEWESGDIFGHVGMRLPDGSGVACKAFRPASITEPDWRVHFDWDAKKIRGTGGPPMEWPMYTEIFAVRPDVQAIAHAHMPACIALSLVDVDIQPVHMQSAKFPKPIPTYPRPIHIKDREEGQALAQALGGAKAVMIKGHGVVSVGRTIDEACMNNMYMERTAKIMGLARTLGFQTTEPGFVEEMIGSRAALTGAHNDEYQRSRGGYTNEWLYYKNRIARGERWTRGWS
jgi:ribulose-5-phosphate 4-epimerase/fuculose-1-phosphate aldolase